MCVPPIGMWARIRGAAAVCGTTHKTVKKIIEAHEAHEAGERGQRKRRSRNFDQVADLVAERVAKSAGRISAKRLLPAARERPAMGLRPGTSAGWWCR
jgi:hypothetical protein